LARQTIDDNARFFDRPEDVPIYAITMGVGTILEARQILLMANGAKKAPAVAAAIEGPVTSRITASALQMHSDVTCLLDTDAASQLEMIDYYRWVQAKHPGAPVRASRPHFSSHPTVRYDAPPARSPVRSNGVGSL